MMNPDKPKAAELLEYRDLDDAHAAVRQRQLQRMRIGLVPTMGALHAGHLSLVEAARDTCDWVIATIFVNPLQFGPDEDLGSYPRTWEDDVAALNASGANAVFAPDVEAMYPPGCTTEVKPPVVAESLEGEFRPGHFLGVATVVLKLFQVLPADEAFFGWKDYQQCLVVRDMVRDLNVPIKLIFCPTVRDEDGLALSSRNQYLDVRQREQALSLVEGLQLARQLVADGERSTETIEASVAQALRDRGVREIDYVAVRDSDTLAAPPEITDGCVLLIAAHVGSTRLIDNCVLRVPS